MPTSESKALARSIAVGPDPRSGFRSDIAGLRAVAVLGVVLFHAGLTLVPGGFVGVDVFFVISGFLITGLLLKGISRSGAVDLLEFWSRRVRRLVPAAALMIIVTSAFVLIATSSINFREVMTNAAASVLYVSNFVFAFSGSDYFAEDLAVPNPFLHTWTLGVEEQFYLVLPVILFVVAWLARNKSERTRHVMIVLALVLLFAISFALSVRFSETRPDLSFYLLPTRLWEFASGGLLAAFAGSVRLAATARNALGFAGLAGLIASFVYLSNAVVFPGWLALLPVISTLAVISAGTGQLEAGQSNVAARLLSLRPFQWIGDISYSLYLWHWPSLVLVPLLLPQLNGLLQVVVALALSLAFASASYHLIENPIRYAPSLQSVKRTFAMGFAVSFAALAIPVSGHIVGFFSEQSNADLIAAREQVVTETSESIADIEARLVASQKDSYTVLLVGDSHGAQWAAAFAQLAQDRSIEFVEVTKNACPAIAVVTASTRGVTTTNSCKQFRTDTLALIQEVEPDIVILAQAEGYLGRIRGADGSEVAVDEQLRTWEAAYRVWIEEVAPYSGAMGYIIDNPRFPSDPTECLVEAEDPLDCGVARPTVLEATAALQLASARARESSQPITFSTIDEICNREVCAVWDDGIPIYRDFNHLAKGWTLTQVPRLTDFVDALIKRVDDQQGAEPPD